MSKAVSLLGKTNLKQGAHIHQPTAWVLPNTCAQQYHPCSGSNGQLFCPYWGSSAQHSHQTSVWTKLSSEALYWCHGVRQVQSTPLSTSSTQHIWELTWLGTAQQFSHGMHAGEGRSGVTLICVPVNSIRQT